MSTEALAFLAFLDGIRIEEDKRHVVELSGRVWATVRALEGGFDAGHLFTWDGSHEPSPKLGYLWTGVSKWTGAGLVALAATGDLRRSDFDTLDLQTEEAFQLFQRANLEAQAPKASSAEQGLRAERDEARRNADRMAGALVLAAQEANELRAKLEAAERERDELRAVVSPAYRAASKRGAEIERLRAGNRVDEQAREAAETHVDELRILLREALGILRDVERTDVHRRLAQLEAKIEGEGEAID